MPNPSTGYDIHQKLTIAFTRSILINFVNNKVHGLAFPHFDV